MKLVTLTSYLGLFGIVSLGTYYIWPWSSTDVIGQTLAFYSGVSLLGIGLLGLVLSKLPQ